MEYFIFHQQLFCNVLRDISKKNNTIYKKLLAKPKRESKIDWKDKEAIRDYKRLRGLKQIQCICGKTYSYSAKTDHLRTKYHKLFMEMKKQNVCNF